MTCSCAVVAARRARLCLQMHHAAEDDASFFDYDNEGAAEAMASLVHELGDVQYEAKWARVRCAHGTAGRGRGGAGGGRVGGGMGEARGARLLAFSNLPSRASKQACVYVHVRRCDVRCGSGRAGCLPLAIAPGCGLWVLGSARDAHRRLGGFPTHVGSVPGFHHYCSI